MKGSLRRIHDHIKNKTNFNDWSDPKCTYLLRRRPEPTSQEKCSSELLKSPVSPKESVLSQTSKEIEEIQKNVKAGLPLVSLDEVRDFRLPFHESLLLKLHDNGFIGTYQFIKDIIDLDDDWHKITEEDYLVRKRPQLKFNEPALRLLSDGLSAAEIANKEGNKADELISILDLALSFTKMDDGSWYWLSEELYEQCIHITDSVESPTELDRELAAILKYLFGEFLLDFLHETDRAKHFVEESMKLSEGKLYNAVILTGQMKDFLYFDSCILLHRILLAMAHEATDSNNENAVDLIEQSLHWAKVVNNKIAESEALLCLIDIYITTKQVDKIPDHLKNYFTLCTEQNNISGLCEGYILSAKYHNLTEEHDLEGEDLHNLLKTATEQNLLEMIALAHHKLAIFYLLHENKQEDAQFHAIEAYHCYINLNMKPEIQASSFLIGICQGQRILPEYIQLISKADKVCSDNFDTLMKWNTLRIPFFENVKLLQLESDENTYLQNKMENLRYDEINFKEPENDNYRLSGRTLISKQSILSKLNYG